MITGDRLDDLCRQTMLDGDEDLNNALGELRWRRQHGNGEEHSFTRGCLTVLGITALASLSIYLIFFAPIGCIQ